MNAIQNAIRAALITSADQGVSVFSFDDVDHLKAAFKKLDAATLMSLADASELDMSDSPILDKWQAGEPAICSSDAGYEIVLMVNVHYHDNTEDKDDVGGAILTYNIKQNKFTDLDFGDAGSW